MEACHSALLGGAPTSTAGGPHQLLPTTEEQPPMRRTSRQIMATEVVTVNSLVVILVYHHCASLIPYSFMEVSKADRARTHLNYVSTTPIIIGAIKGLLDYSKRGVATTPTIVRLLHSWRRVEALNRSLEGRFTKRVGVAPVPKHSLGVDVSGPRWRGVVVISKNLPCYMADLPDALEDASDGGGAKLWRGRVGQEGVTVSSNSSQRRLYAHLQDGMLYIFHSLFPPLTRTYMSLVISSRLSHMSCIPSHSLSPSYSGWHHPINNLGRCLIQAMHFFLKRILLTQTPH
jgi:hypothetical protein